VEYHTNGGGGSWHASRHTSGQLSFEGSWILLLNNNSRELVPITDYTHLLSEQSVTGTSSLLLLLSRRIQLPSKLSWPDVRLLACHDPPPPLG